MNVPKGPKGVRPRKPVGLQIAETKQHEIALRRANGESKTSIAKSLGMSRKTINRILSQGEYQSIVQLGRSQLAELVPRAGDVLNHFLNTKRRGYLPHKAADVALAILNGSQVSYLRAARTSRQPCQINMETKEQILEYIDTGKKPNEGAVSHREALKTDSRMPECLLTCDHRSVSFESAKDVREPIILALQHKVFRNNRSHPAGEVDFTCPVIRAVSTGRRNASSKFACRNLRS